MAMDDKITTHIFKFLYKSITTHYGGGGGGGGQVHMNIFKKLKNEFLHTPLYVLVLCKLIPTHIYKAQVPNGNQLLRIIRGGVHMNILKKSKN